MASHKTPLLCYTCSVTCEGFTFGELPVRCKDWHLLGHDKCLPLGLCSAQHLSPPPPCGQFYYYLMVSSHHNPDVINVAAEEKIIYSPLHAIALSQPLDKGPFSPLKTCWKRAGRTVTRYDFSTLFSEAWKCAMSQANVVAGFRTTGVHPFSRDKIEITATKHPKSCGKVLTSQEA